MEAVDPHDFLVNLCLAIGAGLCLVALARRLNLPTIVLLLVGGIGLGPEGLGVINPHALADALPAVVSLAVGVILFEGGLTLDLHGFAQASKVIQRLLTVGVLVTWWGTAAALYVVFRHSPAFSVFAGSLVIVTGPTVIVPLLRRMRIRARLHNILHWEGVLIDAIGVFVAILCYEWVVAGNEAAAVTRFLLRVLSGAGIGLAGGLAIDFLIRRGAVPESLVNAFALAGAVLIFGLTEAVIPEAGLLAVTLAGLVLGWRHPAELKQIKQFKAEITDLLIGTLFVILAGRLQLARFLDLGLGGAIVIAVMIFAVRPLSVWISTVGSNLDWRERSFLSWVAPRGIVAASLASLFALDLEGRGRFDEAVFIETFVYSVIAATVVIQGFSAGVIARILGLRRPEAKGWLILGAHRLAAELASFIHRRTGVEATVVETNPRLLAEASDVHPEVLRADALDPEVIENDERMQRAGRLVAFTDNPELNELACHRWSGQVTRDSLHRWGITGGDSALHRGHAAGIVIWQKLPLPSLLSAELRRGEATLQELEVADPGDGIEGHVLAIARRERVILDPASRSPGDLRKGDAALVLQRAAGFLSRGLQIGGVLELKAETMFSVHEQLAEEVGRRHPRVRVDALKASLAERERAMPTQLGHGVSVPHAFVAGITRRIVVLGRLQPGIELAGQDERVTLVFLIVSPAGDAEGHLSTLADVAHLCQSDDNRLRLKGAADAGEVLSIVRDALER